MSADPPPTTDSDTDAETEPEKRPESNGASTPPATTRRSLWARLIGLLGVAVIGAGFWLAADQLGLIAAAMIGLCWYLLSGPYAVAIGHGAFLVLASGAESGTVVPALGVELLIAEVGLAILLVAPAIDTDDPSAFVGLFLGSLVVLLAVGAAVYWWSSLLWITAAVLLGALALGGYGLYRYELVRLGLVDGETA